jgi:hypothetical protein
MTSETSRLWVKVVVAITSPSYRALAGSGDALGAAKTHAPGLDSEMSPPAQQRTDEAPSDRETSQVHAAV